MKNPRLIEGSYDTDGNAYYSTDITLLDLFAGMIRAGLIPFSKMGQSDEALAKEAYRIANELINVRKLK